MNSIIILCCFFLTTAAYSRDCIREGYVITPKQEGNMTRIQELVIKYNPLAFEKHGKSIQLKFHLNSCDIFQILGGHNSTGQIVLEVYSGALKNFDKNQIVAAICHEIGHFLGEVTLEDAGVHGRATSKDAVEGEADYFAGKCTLDFLKNYETAESSLRRTYESLYQKVIDETLAMNDIYLKDNGISPSYPSAECRQLSALQGLKNKPRPRCWYNPNLSRD